MLTRIKEKFPQPIIGMRIVKSVIAILSAALFMKYVMHDTPFFACIGAVVAVERTMASSLRAIIIRNVGTITGGIVGIIVASFTENIFLLSIGLTPMFILNNLLNKKESNVPGAIVYFAVAYLNPMDHAMNYGLHRILGTFIGTMIGIAVNALIFPPKNECDCEPEGNAAIQQNN